MTKRRHFMPKTQENRRFYGGFTGFKMEVKNKFFFILSAIVIVQVINIHENTKKMLI